MTQTLGFMDVDALLLTTDRSIAARCAADVQRSLDPKPTNCHRCKKELVWGPPSTVIRQTHLHRSALLRYASRPFFWNSLLLGALLRGLGICVENGFVAQHGSAEKASSRVQHERFWPFCICNRGIRRICREWHLKRIRKKGLAAIDRCFRMRMKRSSGKGNDHVQP
jgi:hypothetical protein